MVTQQARLELKAELIRLGLTQVEVARRMDISTIYMNQLLNGQRRWNRRMARAFSFATGIPLSAILPNGKEAAA